MRKVFYDVIVTMSPDQFKSRLQKSREYSHILKVNYITTEGLQSHLDENDLP
jgi:hypothetical protein